MRLVHQRGFALIFWVVAFLAGVAGLVFGAKVGYASAPEFSEGSGAGAGSQLLTALVGAALGAAVVWALFAGVWMALWALDRRAHPNDDDYEYDTLDDLDDDFESEDGDSYDAESYGDGAARPGSSIDENDAENAPHRH